MLPIPQNDTVRLVIHAVCFLTIFIGVVVLVALDQIDPQAGLTWVVNGAGLVSTALSTAKMLQDRRRGDGQETAADVRDMKSDVSGVKKDVGRLADSAVHDRETHRTDVARLDREINDLKRPH